MVTLQGGIKNDEKLHLLFVLHWVHFLAVRLTLRLKYVTQLLRRDRSVS